MTISLVSYLNWRCSSQGIPKRFVRIYVKILSDTMFLKIPNCAAWKVGLMGGDDGVWFQSGWQEFAEYYSIGYGHFLVFRYEGDSTFRVLIFDKTASEIEYPTTKDQNHEEPSVPTMTESVEILDVFPAGEATKEKEIMNVSSSGEGDSPCLPETVKIESDVSVKIESDVSVEMFDVLPTRERHGIVIPRALPPLTARKKVGAVQRAGAFNPPNPFFRVKMGPSYVSGRSPVSF